MRALMKMSVVLDGCRRRRQGLFQECDRCTFQGGRCGERRSRQKEQNTQRHGTASLFGRLLSGLLEPNHEGQGEEEGMVIGASCQAGKGQLLGSERGCTLSEEPTL